MANLLPLFAAVPASSTSLLLSHLTSLVISIPGLDSDSQQLFLEVSPALFLRPVVSFSSACSCNYCQCRVVFHPSCCVAVSLQSRFLHSTVVNHLLRERANNPMA